MTPEEYSLRKEFWEDVQSRYVEDLTAEERRTLRDILGLDTFRKYVAYLLQFQRDQALRVLSLNVMVPEGQHDVTWIQGRVHGITFAVDQLIELAEEPPKEEEDVGRTAN
jgi:hypothetical protein